jgi:chromate transporter
MTNPVSVIPLSQIARVFFKLGAISFGGPVAHLAMMEEEVVKKRGWVSHAEFVDMLGMTTLIPGPNSTEMAIHIGQKVRGWKGLLIAGICFIFPSVVIALGFAWAYVSFGAMPDFTEMMVGIRAAVLVIIAGAVFRFGHTILKTHFVMAVSLVVMCLHLLGVNEAILMLVSGGLGVVWGYRHHLRSKIFEGATLVGLVLFFLQVGATLYGSGYVLISYLQGTLVDKLHWLSQSQLMDSIAIGQFTPGPVLSTATFVGYLVMGVPGAIGATVAIFLPSFVLVMASCRFLARAQPWPFVRSFLDGVNGASLGLLASAGLMMSVQTLSSFSAIVLFLISASLSLTFNVNALWVILGSAAIGLCGL